MADPSIQTPPGSTDQPSTSPPQILLPGGSTPRSALFIVFLVVFIDLLGFGIVLPLLPLIGDDYLAALFPVKLTDKSIESLRDEKMPDGTKIPDEVLSTLASLKGKQFKTRDDFKSELSTVLDRNALDLYQARIVKKAQFSGGEQSATAGSLLGLLMAAFSLMQFIFAPIWGRVSDRVGRRPILLIGLVGSVVFYTLFGYASDLPASSAAELALVLLFAARIGQGIAGATIATAQAVIADCTTPDKRRHGMALIGAAFGIGFTFGPLIGAGALGLFPQYRGATGYVAAGLSFIALLLGLKKLPETRTASSAPIKRGWLDFHAIRTALGRPVVGPVVLTFFLATLGFGAFETTLSMMNRDLLNLPDERNFLMFAYVGFVLMLTQGVLYRRLAKRVTETTFMTIGIVLMGGGVAGIGVVNRMKEHGTTNGLLALMMIGMTLAVMGFAFLTPSAQALVSRGSSADKQGEVLGVNQSASAMARILGPLFGLTLYKATPDHVLPYGFGAVLLLAMLPMIPRIRRGAAQVAAAEAAH